MSVAMKMWLGLAVFGLFACDGKDVNLGDGTAATSSAITYVGACTPESCVGQEAAASCGSVATLECQPDPAAGQGSDPAGHCNLEAVCPSPDAGSSQITYVGGCTPDSCAGQAAAASCGVAATLECEPDPAAGQGSDPAGHCNLEALCPDAG